VTKEILKDFGALIRFEEWWYSWFWFFNDCSAILTECWLDRLVSMVSSVDPKPLSILHLKISLTMYPPLSPGNLFKLILKYGIATCC